MPADSITEAAECRIACVPDRGRQRAVTEIPNVLQAQRLFGEPDYLLRVIATDLRGFQHLYDTELAILPGVQKLTSTLVMRNIVENRSLPP